MTTNVEILKKIINQSAKKAEKDTIKANIEDNILPQLATNIRKYQLLGAKDAAMTLSVYSGTNDNIILRLKYEPVSDYFDHNTYSFDGDLCINISNPKINWVADGATPLAGAGTSMSIHLSTYEISQTIGRSRTGKKFVGPIRAFQKQIKKNEKELLATLVAECNRIVQLNKEIKELELSSTEENLISSSIAQSASISRGRFAIGAYHHKAIARIRISYWLESELQLAYKATGKFLRKSGKRERIADEQMIKMLKDSTLYNEIIEAIGSDTKYILTVRDTIVE